ncbi:hypothetical protein EYF80_053118 [Liparis tanakae]|uniref:Secreted protein n=1 Tax=Liparis tanakae TaxID=230148 RepID=A0A4Z2F6B8_9TELE|nr:hypothetical protein EYF80_053118 [Liparis tanakae]
MVTAGLVTLQLSCWVLLRGQAAAVNQRKVYTQSSMAEIRDAALEGHFHVPVARGLHLPVSRVHSQRGEVVGESLIITEHRAHKQREETVSRPVSFWVQIPFLSPPQTDRPSVEYWRVFSTPTGLSGCPSSSSQPAMPAPHSATSAQMFTYRVRRRKGTSGPSTAEHKQSRASDADRRQASAPLDERRTLTTVPLEQTRWMRVVCVSFRPSDTQAEPSVNSSSSRSRASMIGPRLEIPMLLMDTASFGEP